MDLSGYVTDYVILETRKSGYQSVNGGKVVIVTDDLFLLRFQIRAIREMKSAT